MIQIGMTTIAVVKHLNIVDDASPDLIVSYLLYSEDPFQFQFPKETSSDSIISTITLLTHAGSHSVIIDQFLKLSTAVLTSPA